MNKVNITKENQLYTLYNDDCFAAFNQIQDESIDMILCDPPFGTTACKWDSVLPLDELWSEYNRIIKPNGAMVMFSAQPYTAVLASSNIKNFKYEWIWEKPQGTNPLNCKIMPLKSHENILVFYKKKPTYNPQMSKGTPYGGFSSDTATIGEVYAHQKSRHRDNPEGTRYPKTVLKFRQEKGYHPTQKPVPLMEYLIKTYTNSGETVLDNCMGSGTTGVACVQSGRSFVGMEKEEKYFDTSIQRINDAEFKKDENSN